MSQRKAFRFRRVVAFFLVLGACRQQPPEPVPLDFDTDPRILRGVWTGETDGVRLLLDLDASEPSAEGYTVTGTFQLEDAEPVVIEGHVNTPVTVATAADARTSDPTAIPFSATSVTPGWRLTGFRPELSPSSFILSLYNEASEKEPHFEVSAQGETALSGTKWTLESVRDEPLTNDAALILEFGEKAHEGFSGFDGCNNFGARYLADETSFDIVYDIASDSAECASDALAAQATAYTSALSDAATYQVDDGRLTFADSAGEVVLVFVATPEGAQ